MNLKNIIKNLLLCIFSLILILILIEFYLSKNPSYFPNLGWQGNNLIDKQIKECKLKKEPVGIFGDSFVEFYGNSKINLVKMLHNKHKNNFCNFGLSGIDINDYLNRFLYVSKTIKFREAIFFIYEGNDFNDYLFNETILKQEIMILNENFKIERKQGLIKNFVKSTYSLNLFYRFIFKKYFSSKKHIDINLLKDLYEKKKNSFEIYSNFEYVKEKHKNFSKQKLKLLNSDILNRETYFKSLIFPEFYQSLNKPNNKDFKKQKVIVDFYFNFINLFCEKNGINCNFILIPEANFVSEKYKNEFHNFYQFENLTKYRNKSLITEYLIKKYSNFYYPENIFDYNDFLELDGHFNSSGNDKLSNFVIKSLYN